MRTTSRSTPSAVSRTAQSTIASARGAAVSRSSRRTTCATIASALSSLPWTVGSLRCWRAGSGTCDTSGSSAPLSATRDVAGFRREIGEADALGAAAVEDFAPLSLVDVPVAEGDVVVARVEQRLLDLVRAAAPVIRDGEIVRTVRDEQIDRVLVREASHSAAARS